MKKTRKYVLLLTVFILLIGLLSACQPKPPKNWWQDVVFYEIFVRSFKDSNGDGIGDFNGIIEMLDYLNDGDPNTTDDLGIGGIWLMPINPSPSYHGYDVSDYKAVNPDYGTLEDFNNLIKECHKRGIRVVMDFVINHTSSDHPWFESSKDPNSEYRDWYVWLEKRPNNTAGPWGSNAWYQKDGAWHQDGKAWYYAPFWSEMPDLNYHTPEVTEAIYDATKFWLDLGVDGFRVDAARYLFEEGYILQDSPKTIKWFQDWRNYYLKRNSRTYTVGEVWADTGLIKRYNQPTKGMEQFFMFDLATDLVGSVYSPSAWRATKAYTKALDAFPDGDFASFLTNHDQNRLASVLEEDLTKQKLAAFLLLTGPGTPYIYYGEEIGMTGTKPDEDIRKPMQWSDKSYGGFSRTIPWRKLNDGWTVNNVEAQDKDPNSLLNWYRKLINLRNSQSAMRQGAYFPISSDCRSLYVALRVEENQQLLTIANLKDEAIKGCSLSLEESPLSGVYLTESLMGDSIFENISFGENGQLNEWKIGSEIGAAEVFVINLKK
ncbi:MAG: alpha-amylase [Chloroflexi bacterium]|nr:alpha-amylase [Chloroflexota bacterium]